MALNITLQPDMTVYIGQEKEIKILFRRRDKHRGWQAVIEAPKNLPIVTEKPKTDELYLAFPIGNTVGNIED